MINNLTNNIKMR